MTNDSDQVGHSPVREFHQIDPAFRAEHGIAAATVLAELEFRSRLDPEPTIGQAEIADICVLSKRQVRRAIATLVDLELLAVTKPNGAGWDQTSGYRLTQFWDEEPETTVSSSMGPPVDASMGPPADPSFPYQEALEEQPLPMSKDAPMTDTIPGQIGLLGDGTPTRTEVLRSRTVKTAAFEQFWDRWPRKLGRKKDALRAWDKLLTEGQSVAEIHLRLDRYLAAFDWWNEHHPQTPAKQMHCTTFLNSGHLDYDQICRPSEKADERWGWLAEKQGRRATAGLASIAPEDRIGSPEWKAKMEAMAANG